MKKYVENYFDYVNEAFSNSVIDDVINKIKKYLQGKIGILFELPGIEEIERNGETINGYHYLTKDDKGIRINWLSKGLSKEIHSIDFYTEFNIFEPHLTLTLNGESVAKILPAIVEVYYKMSDNVDIEEYVDDAVMEARTKGAIGKKTKLKAKLTKSTKEKSVSKSEKNSKKELENIKYADPNTIFEDVDAYIQMVIDKLQPSLIVTGLPGVGKTYGVEQMMRKNNLKKIEPIDVDIDMDDLDDENNKISFEETDGDWVHIKGKATAIGLYTSLYKYRNKIIVFDDCDSIWKDKEAINILKGALDSYDKRFISWISKVTTGEKAKIPPKFEFQGAIIFISNLYMKNLDPAIRTRSYVVDITLRASDIILRIKSILNKIMADNEKIKLEHKEIALQYLENYAKKYKDMEISIRAVMNFSKIIASGSPNWKRLLDLQAENMRT